MMRKLAEMIDHLPEGETLTFDEKDIVSCPDCKRKNTRELYPGYRREVTLFTLTQGAPTIHIYDWFCHTCEKKRNFSGKNCAVFPAFRHSCYTTELLYVILEMTCLHALSFRTAYRITRLIARSPSVARKLGRWAQQDLLDQSKRSRRRMNDAFGAFVERLDTSSIHVTEKLFSCSNCEVPLSADDCNELGIEPSRSNDLKRLRAVVIDGTAAGILTKLPDYDRNTTIVRGAEGGFATFHLIKPKLHNNAVKKLFDVMKASLRQWSSARSEASTSQLRDFDSDVLKFWVQNPTKANIRGVVCSKRLLGEKESQFAQLFIDENACFCQGESARRALTNEHWDECEVIRQKFRDPLDNLIARRRVENIRDLLKQLFTVTQYVVPDPGNELEEMVTEENPRGYRDRENETSEEEDGIEEEEEPIRILHGTVSGAWFALNLPIENTSPLFIDSLIALLRFLLLEHISLPYSGRLSNRTESLHAANTQNEEAPLDPVAGTSVEDGIQMNSGAQVEGLEASFNTEEDLPPMVSFAKHAFQLHEELFARLEKYTDCMHFRENGRVHNLPPECECVKEVKTAIVALNDANPILGTFCQELLKLTRPLGVSHSSFVASLVTTSRLHIDEARHFFIALANNLPDECRDYWDEYSKTMRLSNNASLQSLGVNHEIVDETDRNTSHDGGELTSSIAPGVTASNNRHPTGNREATDPTSHEDPNGTNLDDNTSQDRDEYDVAEKELIASKLAGICFPGRLSCRPSIIFKGRDRSDCSKHYKTSRSHTLGLLTVQCSCDSPKLLGFLIMTQAESTALALSSVLTHFAIPPRIVFYDNACNLYKSVLIRVTWLLGKTRLIVDRFHYKSHKCCAYFNPDSYRQYDNERTETAESINARIEKGLKTIRYMKGEKLMPFLRVRFSLLNICACFKQQFTRTDIEDEDMTVFFNAMLPCSCGLCDELEMDKIVATEENGNESEEDPTRGVGRGTNEDEGENGERDEDEDEDEQEDEKEDEKEDE